MFKYTKILYLSCISIFIFGRKLKVYICALKIYVIKNNVIYNKGEKISDVVVLKDGEVIVEGLYLGKYCLVNDYYNECFEILDENTVMINLRKNLDKGKVDFHNVSSDGLDIMGNVTTFNIEDILKD